ncbi:phospho-sugar mutase [Amnibacterium flavum]|uniref:Phosphomannomutase n=1 Tax=Amnibacterium flavum TaxID=2173173 RepID=A0A2V1HYG7_9MICO|nr:phospho-sugar mutase [Amnibacterium flavum]PVZ95827.1 phosphomannomutase [Amnibacterium flavum]
MSSSAPTDARLLAAATAWATIDPDPETAVELLDLLRRARSRGAARVPARAELRDRFGSRLAFGTAGLRGELGAGPNRMNRVVVRQTTAGLARFLLSRESSPSVVIGYDGRKNSAIFARDTAEVLAGAGISAVLLPRQLPTPVLAFAVRHLSASAGVMITASHNPARDNGYKLYLGGADEGSQIVPPADAEVFAQIAAVVADSAAPLAMSTEYSVADDAVLDAYVAATASAALLPDADLPWVYTPMHGVGWETMSRVLRAANAPEPALVTEQLEPDPDFPTVAFPNPEEAGALDLAIRTASETGAVLVVANDPDADRLAIAVRHSRTGAWEQLSGNEVGLLLARTIAERAVAEGRTGSLAASIVSTPGLAAVAAHYGLGYSDTLTGFKWISRVPGLVFGFEEALGYLVDPQKVRDKDGISAALVALGFFIELRRTGVTLQQYRDAFVRDFGWFGSAQHSLRVDDLSRIGEIMSRLRAAPPTALGGIAVTGIDDLSAGSATLPASDVLRMRTEEGGRVIVRPSGTEPKLKVYIDVSVVDGDVTDRRSRGEATLARLTESVGELLG